MIFLLVFSQVNNGVIECHHADKKKKDCKDDVEHACASKLIPKKFGDFVCCINSGSTAFNVKVFFEIYFACLWSLVQVTPLVLSNKLKQIKIYK